MSEEGDEGEILMGRWDCDGCGTRGVLGDAYACSACGAPRPDDVTFYLPDEAEVVSDAAGIAAAEAGPDWQCAFCDSWMPATDARCTNCDASFAESERRQKTGEVGGASPARAPERSPEPRPASAVAARSPRRRLRIGSSLPWKPIAAAAAVLVVVSWLFGAYTAQRRAEHDKRIAAQEAVLERAWAPLRVAGAELADAESELRRAEDALSQARAAAKQAKRAAALTARELEALELRAQPVEVLAHSWLVDLSIEECGSTAHQGWDHPPQAFDVRAEQKVHHTERVVDRVETRYRDERYRTHDGYDTEAYTERVKTGTRKVKAGTTTKNLGNGRFKRVPTYRTEAVYKTVRKTRKVKRMVWKTRKVPYKKTLYRDDPVYRDWFAYKTWVWRPAGSLERRGSGKTILDPEEAPPAQVREALGAKRVARRSVSLALRLGRAQADAIERAVQRERWDAFAVGDPGLLVGDRLLTPAEHAARISRLQAHLAATRETIPPLESRLPPLEAAIGPLEAKLPPLREALGPLRKRVRAETEKLKVLKAARP